MTAIQSLTYLWYRFLTLFWALRGQRPQARGWFDEYRERMHQQHGGIAPKRPSVLARLRPIVVIGWAGQQWCALMDKRKARAAMSTPVRYWTTDQCDAVRREVLRVCVR